MIIKLVVRQKVRAAYRTYPLMRPRYCFKITTLNMALFTLAILQFSQKNKWWQPSVYELEWTTIPSYLRFWAVQWNEMDKFWYLDCLIMYMNVYTFNEYTKYHIIYRILCFYIMYKPTEFLLSSTCMTTESLEFIVTYTC